MNFSLFRLDIKNVLSQVISISMAAAVTLVFLGPVVDHHFVERQHNHSHIYMHTGSDGHWHPASHPFETPHSHSNSDAHYGEHHGIIYQPSNDGIGDSNSCSVITLIPESSNRIHGGDSYARLQANNETKLAETIIIPPKRPPRT